MSDHFTRTRKAIIKTDHNKSWEEKLEPSYTRKVKHRLPEDSAMLLLGVCPREMKRMSTVFVIARK